jgi:hypothetical protein
VGSPDRIMNHCSGPCFFGLRLFYKSLRRLISFAALGVCAEPARDVPLGSLRILRTRLLVHTFKSQDMTSFAGPQIYAALANALDLNFPDDRYDYIKSQQKAKIRALGSETLQ